MPKLNLIAASGLSLVVGIALTAATDAWLATSDTNFAFKRIAMDRCTSSADQITTDAETTARYLRISDCMAANGYLFQGAKPTSACYAENRTAILIKHILPSCYVQPSILSRL